MAIYITFNSSNLATLARPHYLKDEFLRIQLQANNQAITLGYIVCFVLTKSVHLGYPGIKVHFRLCF